MSSSISLKERLSKHTSFFGIPLWILILTLTIFLLLMFIAMLFLYIFIFHRRKKSYTNAHFRLPKNPISPKNHIHPPYTTTSSLDRRLLSCNSTISEIEMNLSKQELQFMFSDRLSTSSTTSGTKTRANNDVTCCVAETRMGSRISLKEIEVVTGDFAEQNVIASGDNSVVYRAVMLDNTRAAVKLLLSNSVSEAEDFVEKVEARGQVRHKNLVKLLGYCVEGHNRILVCEYIDNGNLHQWLHGSQGAAKPLTWDTRMKIIQGIAKGLAYLHEDIEPKIVHQNLKSSNILLDHQWNPKISEVGLAKLHGPEWSISTSLELGNSGYLAEEYICTGIFNANSDVYSFGVLIMEIVSGRLPVDHSQPQVFLIDWLKSMVAQQKIAYVLDPKLPEMPSSKELKRIVLIALRCVDPDVKHRPKMGEAVRMLEPGDLLFKEERQITRAASYRDCPQKNETAANLCNAAVSRHDGGNRTHSSDHENPTWKKF